MRIAVGSSSRFRLAVSIGSLLLYVGLFVALYPAIGRACAILSVLPICAIPLMYGFRRGLLVAAVISLGGTPLLFALFMAPREIPFLMARGTLIGILANLGVAAMIGILHDLLEQISALNGLLNALSRTDARTSLLNRRAVLEAMTEEFARTRRQASDLEYFVATEPAGESEALRTENAAFKKTRSLRDYAGVFSVAVLDVDHFKTVNDVHGHLTGDRVLRELALLLAPGKSLRATDLVGRFGGEEFVILLPLTRVPEWVLGRDARNLELARCEAQKPRRAGANQRGDAPNHRLSPFERVAPDLVADREVFDGPRPRRRRHAGATHKAETSWRGSECGGEAGDAANPKRVARTKHCWRLPRA